MSGKWVDFKTIKEKVSMEMVLSHYGPAGRSQTDRPRLPGAVPRSQGQAPESIPC